MRELRQNLSVYLRRVAAGEALQVTDRGRPVAVLAPLLAGSTARERLIAAGRLIPASGDLLELGPPPASRLSGRLGKALQEQKADRL